MNFVFLFLILSILIMRATSYISRTIPLRVGVSPFGLMAKKRHFSTLTSTTTSPNQDISLKGLGLRVYPDKALRLPNRLVTHIDSHFHQFLTILMNRMRQEEGVGLAAPQIGANVRVIAFNVLKEEPQFKDSDFIPYPLDLDKQIINSNERLKNLPLIEEELAEQTLKTNIIYEDNLKEFKLVDEGDIIMINPRIIRRSEGKIITMPEACLSFDDVFGRVPRHEWVEVAYTPLNPKKKNLEGIKIDAPYKLNPNEEIIKFTGIKSVVFQHEYDHLQGVLFIDRVIEEDKDNTYKRNLKRIIGSYNGNNPIL